MIPVKALNKPADFTHFAVTNVDGTVAVYTEPDHFHVADGHWDAEAQRLVGCDSLGPQLVDELSVALAAKLAWT